MRPLPRQRPPYVVPNLASDRGATVALDGSGERDDIVVWKFGGTSVGDLARLRAVAERLVAAHRAGHRVVAVLSAMGNSTDLLVRVAHELSPRPPRREFDALLSLAEGFSCALAAIAVEALGERAVSLTGPQAGVMTDGLHGEARLREIRPGRILDALGEGRIVLVTGFQGISPSGDITTLGRGGSDASAVALAVALGVRSCEIFTDVPGVFTADPRLVADARLLPSLGHHEMFLLAEAGAGVLQPRAVELAAAHGVDIHVRSSFNADAGTWIRAEQEGTLEESTIVGVAHRHHERLYAARDVSPRAVASVLARRNVAVATLIRNDDAVNFTAPGADQAVVTAALESVGAAVTVRDDLGAVSVVGARSCTRPEMMARTLAALEHSAIDVEFVTSIPGRISCNIPAPAVDRGAQALHHAFGLQRSAEGVAA